MSRYSPDHDYSRRRTDTGPHTSSSSRREIHERDEIDRRDPQRSSRRPEERSSRGPDVVGNPIDRTSQRMNSRVTTSTSSRIEPRTVMPAAPIHDLRQPDPIVLDNRSIDQDPRVLYQDPNTGEYVYRDVRPLPSRSPYAPEDRYDEPRSRPRGPIDTPMGNEVPPRYSEYFCPGDGIEREVIQHEICKYLGHDATCRRGTENGRNGYWIRAYRPFTSAMVQSLREDTIKWLRDKERWDRHGRPQGTYADMQALEERRRYPGEMDIDDDYDRPAPRTRDPDPRMISSGRSQIPVTSAYPQDPGYPAQSSYNISSSQQGYAPSPQGYYVGPDRDPRFPGGNASPPLMGRNTQGGYAMPPYTSSRTAPPVSASIPAAYDSRGGSVRDPRSDMMSGPGFPSQYQDSSRRGR